MATTPPVTIDETPTSCVVVCGEWRAVRSTRAGAIVALAKYLRACGDTTAAHTATRYLRRRKIQIDL